MVAVVALKDFDYISRIVRVLRNQIQYLFNVAVKRLLFDRYLHELV